MDERRTKEGGHNFVTIQTRILACMVKYRFYQFCLAYLFCHYSVRLVLPF